MFIFILIASLSLSLSYCILVRSQDHVSHNLRTCYLPFTYQLPTSCLPVAYQLPTSCLPVTYQLPTSCLPVAYQLPTCYVQVTIQRNSFLPAEYFLRLRGARSAPDSYQGCACASDVPPFPSRLPAPLCLFLFPPQILLPVCISCALALLSSIPIHIHCLPFILGQLLDFNSIYPCFYLCVTFAFIPHPDCNLYVIPTPDYVYLIFCFAYCVYFYISSSFHSIPSAYYPFQRSCHSLFIASSLYQYFHFML